MFTVALKSEHMTGEKKWVFSFTHYNSNVNINRVKVSETSMKISFKEILFYIYIRDMQFFNGHTIHQFSVSKLIHSS